MQDQLVIVMRHGERRDHLPDAPNEADPPLTEEGKRNVALAADRIREAIGPSLARRLVLLTSPFLRTVETAEELQRNGIGSDRASSAIDNTLCEVFGPLRIKSNGPPDVTRKEAYGSLPPWGESIQFASARFVDSFLRNAQEHPFEHLILVSHGDAISAVLSHFYPKRMVYETEFLSFVVMRRRSPRLGNEARGLQPSTVTSSSCSSSNPRQQNSQQATSTHSPTSSSNSTTGLIRPAPASTVAAAAAAQPPPATTVRFSLLHSHGVQWIVDGSDDEEEDGEEEHGVGAAMKEGDVLNMSQLGAAPRSPLHRLVPQSAGSTAGGGGAAARGGSPLTKMGPPGHHRHASTTVPTSAFTVAVPVGAAAIDREQHQDVDDEEERRKQDKAWRRKRLLHILQVVSVAIHLPYLSLWPSSRDACIYVMTLAALELLSLRFGWRSVVDRLPFSYGSPRRRVLYRLARYPVTRTVWKWIVLLLSYLIVSLMLSIVVTKAQEGRVSVTTFTSLETLGTNVWAAVIVVGWFLLETWKGYLQDEEDDDPHREAI